jgi:hypothetical protein
LYLNLFFNPMTPYSSVRISPRSKIQDEALHLCPRLRHHYLYTINVRYSILVNKSIQKHLVSKITGNYSAMSCATSAMSSAGSCGTDQKEPTIEFRYNKLTDFDIDVKCFCQLPKVASMLTECASTSCKGNVVSVYTFANKMCGGATGFFKTVPEGVV